ncbi:MAG: dipeptide epimerase [Saprospiraceae bacterium]|nr:dipeptide epimerase [Saprospiraceae bacterium]
MMQISWKIFSLPLASVFTISKGSFSQRRAMIVQLKQDGCVGYGEATEISYYGISLDSFTRLLTHHLADLKRIELTSPQDYFTKISGILGHEPFLLSAFDCAAHDLYGHLNKKPTREMLQIGEPNSFKPTSFTIGIGEINEMIGKIHATPWPIYKIKLGTDADVDIVRSLREETKAILRVDANEGWTAEETIENGRVMEALGVEFIEQPMPRDADDEMGSVLENTSIRFIADESCQQQKDVTRCKGKYHGINIKLMKCGGLTAALSMIEEARSLGLEIMIGCMTESSIGISAAAQLIPLVDYVDLDGAMLIKKDIASGVKFNQGFPVFPDKNGLGCQLLDVDQQA